MDTCPFCHIKESYKHRTLHEGKHVFVILSDPRLVEGHTLVIPKRHIEYAFEMIDEERKELFDTLLEWQERIMKIYSKGCDIRQNCRPFQPQDWIKQHHVHFHLQPRFLQDELWGQAQRFEREMFRPLPKEECEKFMTLFVDFKSLDDGVNF